MCKNGLFKYGPTFEKEHVWIYGGDGDGTVVMWEKKMGVHSFLYNATQQEGLTKF